MNECLQKAHVSEWMKKKKDRIDTKGPKQWNHPKQLQTHNVPTNDGESINSADNGRNQLLANKPWFVPG